MTSHEAFAADLASSAAETEMEVPTDLHSVATTILETLAGIWTDFLGHLPLLVSGIAVLLVTWWVARIGERLGHRIFGLGRLSKSMKELLNRLVFITIWVLGLLLAAMVVFPGLTPTKALGGLGILSLAVGFAFKDIFENFFAGILLLWRFPFEPGDYVECQGITGEVENITIRNSLIRQTSGELVVVPNSFLFTNPVEVLTNWNKRRVSIIAGVAYGEDVKESQGVIQNAVEGCQSVDSDRPVQVFAQEMASSSVNFEVTWWTNPKPVNIRESRAEVVTAVKKALDEAGIEIPFPYRTLTFKDPLSLLHREEDAS